VFRKIFMQNTGKHASDYPINHIKVETRPDSTGDTGKVHIFWEGNKNLRNLHLILTGTTSKLCNHSFALHTAKVRWRFRKILWPSQNIWTLSTKVSTLTWSCPIPLNYSRSLCSGWLWWCSTSTFPSNSGKDLLRNGRINSLTINAVVIYIGKTMLVILITLNISRYDFFSDLELCFTLLFFGFFFHF
jgi:hypothetical protein